MSGKQKRAMKNDFAVLDNAFTNGYTEYFAEFAEMFLEKYKLASVEKDAYYRKIYDAVKNALASYRENAAGLPEIGEENITDEKEIQKLFSQVLLGTAEDIIAFADRYPNFREKDIYGALERARVNDLETILTTIMGNSIPVNEIFRFSQIYGDSISINRIKNDAEKMVFKNTALLWDYRRVFGITEFDEKIEQTLYNRIMYDTDYKNLITYIEYFPEGKYIKFVKDLANNYR
jgi:hypothetical protein